MESSTTGAPRSLSENLHALIDPGDPPRESLCVRDVAEQVGEKGFGLFLMLFSLPSALPVPAPGYSTPFGIIIILVGLQMIAGRHAIALPGFLSRIQLKQERAASMLKAATRFLHFLERVIRPRMRWLAGRQAARGMGIIVCAMAALMILPIPLTNTAPAMVIFLTGLALSEKDGLVGLGAVICGVVSVALYAVIIWAALAYGPEVIDAAKETVKDWLGLSS